jgi:hypothetical protein
MDINKTKSGAVAPDLSYVVVRTPLPTDRVVWHIDDPSSRKAWLEVTAKLLRECERLVALDEASGIFSDVASADLEGSDNKGSQDTNSKEVDVLHRVNE